VALNVEYSVLIYIGNRCKHILKLAAILQYLDIKYKTAIGLQKQVDEYVREFLFEYNPASVLLLHNRSALQPIIPVVGRFVYRDCLYKTQSWDAARKHGNKAYNKKRVADKHIFTVVQLQL
jgi:hypothetical protein